MQRRLRQFGLRQVRILAGLVVLIGMASWNTCAAAELIGVTAAVDKQTAYIINKECCNFLRSRRK